MTIYVALNLALAQVPIDPVVEFMDSALIFVVLHTRGTITVDLIIQKAHVESKMVSIMAHARLMKHHIAVSGAIVEKLPNSAPTITRSIIMTVNSVLLLLQDFRVERDMSYLQICIHTIFSLQ
jgi:hypothetical protein